MYIHDLMYELQVFIITLYGDYYLFHRPHEMVVPLFVKTSIRLISDPLEIAKLIEKRNVIASVINFTSSSL